MTTLTKHDVVNTKLKDERFDFLLHCKTCGWEGRGFDAFGESADDMTKKHVGLRAAADSGDLVALFGGYSHFGVAGRVEEAKKFKEIEDQAGSLKPSPIVLAPLPTTPDAVPSPTGEATSHQTKPDKGKEK